MSPLRAPAARPDRREGGGRHGRSGARPLAQHGRPKPATPPPDARIRPRLLRAAVPPAAVAALGGAGAVVFTLYSTGARPTAALWTVLGCAAALAVAAVTAAWLDADRAARSVLDRCNDLRRTTAHAQNELRGVVEQLRRGERPPARQIPPPGPTGDDLDLLAHELGRAQDAAVAAVVQASQLSSSLRNEQKVEVFVNLARRLQSLVHREIQLLDELENAVEDPELLKGLFHVDHLATRIRRHAENLAVLGGAIARRQWSNPVSMTEVLRSSIAEVEQYPRVKLVPPIDGTLRGHAVADVIHLLAELVENATLYSAPHTTVLLRAQYVTAGLAVEVEDRGLGMPVAEQEKMNALLCDPDQVNVAHLLQDGRIGLYVVSALARRHGIAVRLQSNIYGGVQAVLVVPQELLGADPANPHQAGRPQTGTSGDAARTAPGTSVAADALPAGAMPSGAARAAIPAPYDAHQAHDAHDPVRAPVAADGGDRLPRQPRHAAPARAAGPQPAPLPVRGGERPDRQPHSPHGPEGASAAHQDPAQGGQGRYATEPARHRPGHGDRAPLPEPAARQDHAGPEPVRPDAAPPQPQPAASPGPVPPHSAGGHPEPAANPPAAPHLPAQLPRHAPEVPAPPAAQAPAQPAPQPAQAQSPPAEGDAPAPVPGQDGRPRLPKRRAQEHLVPQLRDEPVRRRHDDVPLHDPGLMAAFQRGIGLAESMPPSSPPPAAPQAATPHALPSPAPLPVPDASRDRAGTPVRARTAPPLGPAEPQRHDEAHKE
ncbi:ATP-binding protein [Streptomyces thermolilacinus]|uniref:ATP-binding protein n=1 Tax=Streptomyces thermolilacinus TaxID=285540 RepID=UPI0003C7768E|nr:ATP-binding protein [Streptomyces thermolilacinus]